jgi:predicted metal-binding protein
VADILHALPLHIFVKQIQKIRRLSTEETDHQSLDVKTVGATSVCTQGINIVITFKNTSSTLLHAAPPEVENTVLRLAYL